MRIHEKINTTETLGVYIHIPFCIKKCPYCDFNSIAVTSIPEKAYIEAVLKELTIHIEREPALSNRTVDTIYIGGGTPSLISHYNIGKLIRGIRETFSGANYAAMPQEITIEVNPGTVKMDGLSAFRDAGVNRISIGVQSFNDDKLKSLGRLHSAGESLASYEYARRAGFENVGIDLMFGAPGESEGGWETDIKAAISLKPEHVAAYNLTIEKATPFFKLQDSGNFSLPSEEEQALMYELAIDRLVSAGYNHYEISNFSLSGYESRHNFRYWTNMDYIGLGAGAHSYISSPDKNSQGQAADWGTRWWNESSPSSYMRQINETGQAVAGKEGLTKKEALEEAIFLGLRKISGMDINLFPKRFGISFENLYMQKIAVLKREGMIYEDGNRIRLTSKGLILSDEIFAGLI